MLKIGYLWVVVQVDRKIIILRFFFSNSKKNVTPKGIFTLNMYLPLL